MKKLTYKTKNTSFRINLKVFITTLFISFCVGSSLQAQDNTVKKQVSESFKTDKNTSLNIWNKYGEVHINTWNQDLVKVEVTVKAWASNQRSAERLLERVKIDYGQSGKDIDFRTVISSGNINISRRSGFEINYEVSMPSDISLDLANKYGPVYLADFSGELNLALAYDKLKAGKITGKDVDISVKYGSADIDEVVVGDLEFKYCKYVVIDKAGDIEIENKYGGLEIDEVNSIVGTIGYSQYDINKLGSVLELTSSYSGGKVKNVMKGFKNIDVEAKYGSISLEFDQDCSFEFDVRTRYGSFNNDLGKLEFKRQIKYNTSSEYSGTYESGEGGKVRVTSAYGNIRFR